MFTNKFYSKVYFSTIEKAVQRGWKKARGRERHHIIPQSLGGNNDKSNLVYLSCREHFLCHWLLVKMTKGEYYHKMVYALMGMRAENKQQERYHTIFTARVYEKYRIEHAEYHSKLMKSKNLVPWNKGRMLEGVELEEHRERTRNRIIDPIKQAEGQLKRIAKVTGQKRSEETKKLIALKSKGIPKGPMSDEQKKLRSDQQIGKAKSKESLEKRKATIQEQIENGTHHSVQLLECPHCGTKMQKILYARWHGNNCKLKEN